jgi:[ribosomal protein S5]-alanine N-acetyltransferase
MIIRLSNGFYLSPVTVQDEQTLVSHLNDLRIFRNTLMIPYPYGLEEARWWINHTLEKQQETGEIISMLVRNAEGSAIGGIGVHRKLGKDSHRDEIGYWIGRGYENRGIMTSAVSAFTEYCYSTFRLIRIEAHVFKSNDASCRVLEKAGFEREGVLRKYHKKEEKFLDAILYAKLN